MTCNFGLRPQQILEPLRLIQPIANSGVGNTVPKHEDVLMQSDFAYNQPLAGGFIGLLLALRYNCRLALFRKLTRLRRWYFRVPHTRNPFQQGPVPTMLSGVAPANQNQQTHQGQTTACRPHPPSSIPFAQSLPHKIMGAKSLREKPPPKMHKTNTLFQRTKRQISVSQVAACIFR